MTTLTSARVAGDYFLGAGWVIGAGQCPDSGYHTLAGDLSRQLPTMCKSWLPCESKPYRLGNGRVARLGVLFHPLREVHLDLLVTCGPAYADS